MRVCLVSDDKSLDRMYRAIMAELPAHSCQTLPGKERSQIGQAEVCIWDLDVRGVPPTPIELGRTTVTVLLATQKGIDLLDVMPTNHSVVLLLKPVQSQVLGTVIGLALGLCERHEKRASKDSERSARDNLLQCLLETSLQVQECYGELGSFLLRNRHDYIAPLTAASGYCSLLMSRRLGSLSAEQFEALECVQHSLKRITRMSENAYRVSVGEHKRPTLELKQDDIQACIEQSVSEVLHLASEKDISILEEIEELQVPLMFDAKQVSELLVNLLENACKFTPRAGAIQIKGYLVQWDRSKPPRRARRPDRVRENGTAEPVNGYRVDIEDSGPGIEEAKIESIFDPYTSSSGSQDRGGWGLGPAICRVIASAHQGEVFARPSKQGGKFSFVLPVAVAQSPSEPRNAYEPENELQPTPATSGG